MKENTEQKEVITKNTVEVDILKIIIFYIRKNLKLY